MAGITWLHLSDWHQKGRDFDRQVVRDALIKDIQEREKINPDLAQIDFIVFSGDVAHAGTDEEYEAAKENLFEPLLEATGLSTERLFIVPEFSRHLCKGNLVSERQSLTLSQSFLPLVASSTKSSNPCDKVLIALSIASI